MKAIITDAGASGAGESREAIPSLDLFDSPRAWRMVAAAFVAMFAMYGVAYSFGAFFKPMAAEFGARSQRDLGGILDHGAGVVRARPYHRAISRTASARESWWRPARLRWASVSR